MTRIAIISDVHADAHAVADALTQAARFECSAVVCAGDLVDGGLFPDEAIALLQERKIPCIRGNHDRWRVAERRAAAGGGSEDPFTEDAGGSGADLSAESVRFLAALPTEWNGVFDGVRVAVRHGTPRSDMDGIYPGEASADHARRGLEQANAGVLIVGHTHQAFALTTLSGDLIANPGALWRSNAKPSGWVYDVERGTYAVPPAESGGTFGVLELPARRFNVFRAVDGEEVDIPRMTLGVSDERGG
jgi:predicted phosphodiesterase